MIDEAVHGYYIGYKCQRGLADTDAERADHRTASCCTRLCANEIDYAHDLYDAGLDRRLVAYMLQRQQG